MDSNRFRNASGTRYTKGLFYEQTLEDKSTVVYTLKDEDHKGFPSLYKLYLEEEDTTEYTFANKYLDGWEHWKQISECTWFKPYIARWREELNLKLAARSLLKIKEMARGQGRDSYVANTYLLERKWETKSEKSKAGRPTKEAIKQEATRILMEDKDIEEAAKRIGLN